MDNKYTGEVRFKIGDVDGSLVYNWEAIAFLRTNYTQEDFQNLPDLSPTDLATIAEAGFKAKNPELTKEVIMTASPVIMDIAKAIDHALLYGYHGVENAGKILKQMDDTEKAFLAMAEKEASEKKT